MNILIIGSKGFIGRKLMDYFSSGKNDSVWGCDVVNDYEQQRYFLIDVSNSDFADVFQKQSFDLCINCSGAASVPDSIQNPLRDYLLNTVNVYKILDAIRKFNNTCKFINFSSAAVYGNPERLPISENESLKPLSPYGNHKLYSELICKQFYQDFGIRTISLRIFSAYGPGLQKQLFWDLYQKSKTQDTITLFGSGNESRDFIFIDDLVKAIEAVIQQGVFEGECLNVANGQEITIREAVTTFYALLGGNKKVIFENNVREGDPLNWKADITRLQKIGYVQKVSLKEGLTKYIQWLSERK